MSGLRISGLATPVLAVALAYGAAQAADPITFKLGHVDNAASHSGVGVEAFAAEVERLSDGAMKVEVFHAGQLGPIPDEIANVFSGAQDMHLLYPEFLGTFVEESKVISLPYVFDDLEHLQAFYKSELWQPAIETLEENGAVLLDPEWTWKIYDPRGFISTKPVFTPSDLADFKMRIWEAKAAIETWQGFGATTTVVPRPEMYLAFQQGIIEGGPETIGIAYDQKNVEMAKYWVRTDEYYQIINIMMNKARYESLSDEQRAILHQAAANAGETFRQETMANFNTKKRQAGDEYGVSVIEPALGPWRERAKETIAKLQAEGFVPAGFVEQIRDLEY
jgi:TRAP-type transport system periplasmic protein